MNLAEALALGFGSGPVCVASCGPVLLPWLGAEPRDVGTTGRLLAIFLGGRLAGYLSFAVVAWAGRFDNSRRPAYSHAGLRAGQLRAGCSVGLFGMLSSPPLCEGAGRTAHAPLSDQRRGSLPPAHGPHPWPPHGTQSLPAVRRRRRSRRRDSQPARCARLLRALFCRDIRLVPPLARGQLATPLQCRSRCGPHDHGRSRDLLRLLGSRERSLLAAGSRPGRESFHCCH